MAVFGAPVAHDDDPERAVRAALAIHEAAAGIEVPGGGALRLHIGIASGQVVASGTGSTPRREAPARRPGQ
jgi:class 3 adenylate cyclase